MPLLVSEPLNKFVIRLVPLGLFIRATIKDPLRLERVFYKELLLEKFQDLLRLLVGLRQHCSSSLGDYTEFGVGGHFGGHIHIAD